jgi:hypothetical protein
MMLIAACAAARVDSELPSTVVAVRNPLSVLNATQHSLSQPLGKEEPSTHPPSIGASLFALSAPASLAKRVPRSEAEQFVLLTARVGLVGALQSSTSPGVMWRTALELRHIERTKESATFITTSLLLIQSKMQQIHNIMRVMRAERRDASQRFEIAAPAAAAPHRRGKSLPPPPRPLISKRR